MVSYYQNNGPVDLSRFHTFVPSRGTWSIGGQRSVTEASPQILIQAPSNQSTTSGRPNAATASTSTNQPGPVLPENKAPIRSRQLDQSAPDVDLLNSLSKIEDAKDGRSKSNAEITKYERNHAPLLDSQRNGLSAPIRYDFATWIDLL
jgi:hypothetical protein